MAKILTYIAFLIIYCLYVWVSTVLLTKFVNRPKDRFIDNELLIIIPNLFLFASLFVINHFLNLYLVLFSIAFSNIGLLIASVVWGLLGSPKIPYKAISGWAGTNFAIENIWFSVFYQAVAAIISIAYPIIIGVYYFKGYLPEQIGTITLECTLIFILASFVLLIPTIISVLTANYIDEDTRSRYLISQFSNLIPYTLYISLLFWIINPGGPGKGFTMQNVELTFNPLLFTLLMVFFLAFFVLPYFIGIQKAKQMKNDYFESKNDILEHLIKAIDLATPKNIITRLDEVAALIEAKFNALKSDNATIIDAGLAYDAISTAENLPNQEVFIFNCYKSARAFDKRFMYFDFLNKTYQDIIDLKSTQSTETDPEAIKEVFSKYSASIKDDKKDLNDLNDKKGGSNPLLWVGLTALGAPFFSQVMTEVGKYLIEYFKKM